MQEAQPVQTLGVTNLPKVSSKLTFGIGMLFHNLLKVIMRLYNKLQPLKYFSNLEAGNPK